MSKLLHLLISEDFSLCTLQNELDRGSDPNEVSPEEGVCAMHLAAGLGDKVVGLLVQYGGDPNARSREGMTPLHVAASYGALETLTLLLRNGANANLQDEDGKRALDLAVENEHQLCVRELKIHTMLANVEDSPYIQGFSSDDKYQEGSHNQYCDSSHHHLNYSYIEPEVLARQYADTITKKLYNFLSEGRKVCFDATSPTTPFVGYKSSCCRSHCDNNSGDSPLRYSCCDEDLPSHHNFIDDSSFVNEEKCPHCFSNHMKRCSCFCGGKTGHQPCSPTRTLHGKHGSSYVNAPQFYHQSCYSNRTLHGKHSSLCDKSSQFHHQLPDPCNTSCYCGASNQRRAGKCNRVLSPSPSKCSKGQNTSMMSDDKTLPSCVQKNITLSPCHSPKNGQKSISSFHSKFDQNKYFQTPLVNSRYQTMSKSNSASFVGENETDIINRYFPTPIVSSPSVSSESKLSRVAEYVLSCTDFSSQCTVNDTNNKNTEPSCDQSSIAQTDLRNSGKEKGSLVCQQTCFKDDKKSPKRDNEFREVSNISSSSADSFCTAADESNSSSPDHAVKNTDSSDAVLKNLCDAKDSIALVKEDTFFGGNNSSTRWHPPIRTYNDIVDDSIMTSESSFLGTEKLRFFPKIPRSRLKNFDHGTKKNEFGCHGDPLSSELLKKREELGYKSDESDGELLDNSLFSTLTADEYLYTDPDNGIALVEKRIPSECGGSIASRRSLDSMSSKISQDSQATLIYDWKTLKTVADSKSESHAILDKKLVENYIDLLNSKTSQTTNRGLSTNGSDSVCHSEEDSDQTLELHEEDAAADVIIPLHLKKLSNEQLSQELEKFGEMPGPVIASTRQVYLRRLASLEAEPGLVRITKTCPDYPAELRQAMNGLLDWSGVSDLENQMVDYFATSQGRQWREGCAKSSFTYLLLDPRVTNNLPLRAKDLSELEVFKTFICAIFYIGKGKRARPYCHLYEAVSKMGSKDCKMSAKVQHIIDIWGSKTGVVSLHCFQSVIPVEAYTREACMLEAIGMYKVTNVKRGDFYGIVSTWPMRQRRRLGVYLLHKAMTIFLAEGERQICIPDLKSHSQ